MNALNALAGAHDDALGYATRVTAPLPLIIKVPVAMLVWAVALIRAIVIGLISMSVGLLGIALVAHAVFSQGKSGYELAVSWFQLAQQNLGGWQLASAIAAAGATTAIWLYKSHGTLGKIEHIVNRVKFTLGASTEDPELADLRATAERHGYRLVPVGTIAENQDRPQT